MHPFQTEGSRPPGRIAALVALGTLLLMGAGPKAQESPRPNILLLLSDDQPSGSLGCSGHPWLKTPAIDQLAREGARFLRSYVTTSLCCPGRASLLSGQYARSHGILENVTPLTEELVTFASLLSASGYDSAYIGKWHMGKQAGPRPGFSYTASYVGQGAHQRGVFHVGREQLRAQPYSGWVDDVATDYAIEFLQREREDPFLLVLGFKSPHGPRQPSERHRQLYKGMQQPQAANASCFPPFPTRPEFLAMARQAQVDPLEFRPDSDWLASWEDERIPVSTPRTGGRANVDDYLNYARLLTGMDENIGRLLAVLKEQGLEQSTVVVFTSDNGLSNGSHAWIGKQIAYEESISVPLIIRYPALVQAGSLPAELALNLDLAPTLLQLAGLSIPPSMQGRSLVPLMAPREPDAAPPAWRQDFLYEYWRMGKGFPYSICCLHGGDWKLIRYLGHDDWTELFHLAEDPLEEHNLAGLPAHAERLQNMLARLADLEVSIGPRPAAGRTR